MARINFPNRFAERYALFNTVKAKHDADGVSSVLLPYLASADIDLDYDQTQLSNATTLNAEALSREKGAELHRNERDLLFDPVFKQHKDCVQFLKSLYRHNVHLLGLWGVTVDGENRISYPVDFLGRVAAVTAFIDYHNTSVPPTSPVQPFLDQHNIDFAVTATDVAQALLEHSGFLSDNEIKENKVEQRDNIMDPIMDHLRGIGQFLVNFYNDNPHNAGLWGFVIDSSPQADHVRSFTISSGEVRTVNNVVLATRVKNIGSTTLLIRKATDVSISPITLNPNQEFTIIRGYGKLTVENVSGSVEGAFEATLNG